MYKRQVLAWDPGGDVPQGTILQMWNGTSTLKPGYPALDSRHLYLNHFDPFDAVVSIFNHRIDDATTGDEMRLGAILCNWPDRRVTREEDLIKMNAVYPAMLTFAQRSWQGKGYENFLSDIGKPGTARFNDFVSFENALLDHKQQYFQQKPFPYFRQSDIEWKLIGPFDNKGNTGTSFLPEQKGFLDTLHTSAPVSYTHLDVYKRQVLDSVHMSYPKMPFFISEFGLCEPNFKGGDERRLQDLIYHMSLYETKDYVQGAIYFDLTDYRTH